MAAAATPATPFLTDRPWAMKLGRFELHHAPPQPAEDPAGYLDRLSDLAAILGDVPWMLAGGLTIPVTLGRFYRRHYDVDIAFPEEAFPAVDAAMCGAGYYLSTHFPMSLFGRLRFSLVVPLRADGSVARRRPRKLKYRDATGTRGVPNLLAVVEALPYRIVDGCFATCDGRHRLPLDRPLVGHRVRTGRGREIACLDLHYATRILRGRDHPKHALDRTIVANHFPACVRAERD